MHSYDKYIEYNGRRIIECKELKGWDVYAVEPSIEVAYMYFRKN